jgi:predicted GIY-YIG superfamily endonuclease
MQSKTLKLFLPQGEIAGIICAEISNFTGSVLTVPRTQLGYLEEREEIKSSGIYILRGSESHQANQTAIYIGRSDNIYGRLKQHKEDKSKSFWDRAAIIFSKDLNLTQSHIHYLENKLIELAIAAQQSIVTNRRTIDLPYLSESDIADVDSFLEQIRLLLSVVDFNYFESREKLQANELKVLTEYNDSPVFYMNSLDTKAYARQIDNKFVVLKNSIARDYCINSIAVTYGNLRRQLIQEGKLMLDSLSAKLIFTQDVIFKSPTAAASVIAGGNLSGKKTFKIKDTDITYGDWDRQKNSSG